MLGLGRVFSSAVRPRTLIRAPINKRSFLWYSTEAAKEEKVAETENVDVKELQSKLSELKSKYEAKDKEVAELKGSIRQSLADYRNLENRMKRDMEQTRAFAVQKLTKDLLDSVDNLERALSIVPEEKRNNRESNKDLVDLYEGLAMTESNLMKTLGKYGLVRYDGIGEDFDPNIHEAVFQIPVEGKKPNTVFHCESKGFQLNGRVIRPAKVGVVKGDD
ncbi:GrpE nucleotide exchange factor [Schizosaccharomyces pombe]